MRPVAPADADPRTNALLRAVPASEWGRWSIYLEPVHMAHVQVSPESGLVPGYVYFPTTAIVSLLYMTEDGASSELAVIGHEGIVGVSLFMGGNTMPHQAVVQSAGLGFRLLALDRLPSGALMMTQELLAGLSGVRREGVTAALSPHAQVFFGGIDQPPAVSQGNLRLTGIHRKLPSGPGQPARPANGIRRFDNNHNPYSLSRIHHEHRNHIADRTDIDARRRLAVLVT